MEDFQDSISVTQTTTRPGIQVRHLNQDPGKIQCLVRLGMAIYIRLADSICLLVVVFLSDMIPVEVCSKM